MKKELKLEVVWDQGTELWDCFVSESHGRALLATVDPRDFPGEPEEHKAKAKDLAYREGLDVLREIVKEPENPVIVAARAMRAAQRAYCKDRSHGNLLESTRLEAEFDRLLAALTPPAKPPVCNNLRLFQDD